MPSDNFRLVKRRWRGASVGCWRWLIGEAMGVQRCRGSGGASLGYRQQRIVIGGASAVPSDARANGGGIGGSMSAELWWGHCPGSRRWQRICE